MFPGYKATFGGKEYIVPALSLGQLRSGVMEKLAQHDKLAAEGKTFETQVLRGEIIHTALTRNYPDVSSDLVFDNLDLANVTPIWLAVLGLTGFTPGEAPAATATEQSGT